MDETAALRRMVEDREALIQWLALPYAGDPVFTAEDQPSEERRRLEATWEAVVGTKGPQGPGEWVQCRTCGMWQVIATVVPAVSVEVP